MVTFVIGGMTGVLLAVPPADFVLHNSLFLVAHFHNVIIGGTLFGAFAGYTYWFPKAFGFRLHEGLGKLAFWFWIVGFYVAFMPLYWLGFLGMTRRMQHYDVAAWRPWLLVAGCGALLILCGIVTRSCSCSPPSATATACATRSATVGRALAGMGHLLAAARLQLRRCCPTSAARRPTGASRRPPATSSTWRRAGVRGHRDAAQLGHRLRLRLLRHGDRLRADLAHLVDGGAGLRGGLRHLRGVRLARRGRGAGDRRRRWRASPARTAAAAPTPSRPPAGASARPCRREHRPPGRPAPRSAARRPRQPPRARRPRTRPATARAAPRPSGSSSATASGSSCCPTSSCSRRSSPPTRCWSGATAGGPDGRKLFDLPQRGDGDGLPAALVLRLRHGRDRRVGAAEPGRVPDRHGVHLRSSARASCSWSCASSPGWSRRARAAAFGLPVGLLRPGGLPRPARDHRGSCGS